MIGILSITLLVTVVHGIPDNAHLCDELQTLDCGKDYVPIEQDETVCASDGKTYSNFCYYGQARCATPTTHIVSVGWCDASTTTVTTPPPTAVPTGGPTTVTADSTTAATMTLSAATMTSSSATMTTLMTTQNTLQQVFCASKDSVVCGTDLDPVCGSDGTFYLNKCEFSKAQCDNRSLTSKGIDFCTGAGK